MSRTINANGRREPSTRVSGYVTLSIKKSLTEELNRVAQVEGLRNARMGTLLTRIASSGLRLDWASLAKYRKTHAGTKIARG